MGLELTDPGFDSSVLSLFRSRLLNGGKEKLILDKLLECCKELELLKSKGKARTDSTHILAAIRNLNRLEYVGETLRSALNALAVAHPEEKLHYVQGTNISLLLKGENSKKLKNGQNSIINVLELKEQFPRVFVV